MSEAAPMHPAKFRLLGMFWIAVGAIAIGLVLPTTRDGTVGFLGWLATDLVPEEVTEPEVAEPEPEPDREGTGDPSDSVTFPNSYMGEAGTLQSEGLEPDPSWNFQAPSARLAGASIEVLPASQGSTSTTEPPPPTSAPPTTATPTTAPTPTYTIVPRGSCKHVLSPDCGRGG